MDDCGCTAYKEDLVADCPKPHPQYLRTRIANHGNMLGIHQVHLRHLPQPSRGSYSVRRPLAFRREAIITDATWSHGRTWGFSDGSIFTGAQCIRDRVRAACALTFCLLPTLIHYTDLGHYISASVLELWMASTFREAFPRVWRLAR